MNDINHLIDKAHSAAEAAEDQARQIEARIAAIPGAARLIPLRQYGKPVDGKTVGQNLTLRSMVERHDPALAAYLGFGSDVHRREAAEAAERHAIAERMAAQTAALREQNQAAQLQRERAALAGYNHLTRRAF
jgi:hypothetical protein